MASSSLGLVAVGAVQHHAGHAFVVVAQHFSSSWFQTMSIFSFDIGPLGHDLRRPQLIAAVDQVDAAGEFRQVGRFFDGRIAAADHDQRLVAKPRQRAVAHRASTDAAILEGLLRRQTQVVGPGAGGHDHRLGLDDVAAERRQWEGCRWKSTLTTSSVIDARAEVLGLLPHQLHQFRPADAVLRVRGHHVRGHRWSNGAIEIGRQIAGRKPGVVFHFGGQIQLSQGERAAEAVFLGDRPLEDQRAESSARAA